MHAPAGCLKTPACLHSAQQSCGIHGCRAEREGESSLSSLSVFLSVFRLRRNKETSYRFLLPGEYGRRRSWKSDAVEQNLGLEPSPRRQERPRSGGRGNEEGSSKSCHRPTSCQCEHTHTHTLQRPTEPDSVISQRFSLTPGVSLPPIKFPSDLYVNVRAKKTR